MPARAEGAGARREHATGHPSGYLLAWRVGDPHLAGMTNRILTAASAAALAALVLTVAPAMAQGPALPLESPSERIVRGTNRDLLLQRRIGEIERQRAFDEGQLRQRLDRLEMFPRLAPPTATPPGAGGPGIAR